jgi:hypothetical protein
MAEGSPFGAQRTGPPGQKPPPFANFGRYFSVGFQVYFQRWRDWIVPMLVAALVMLAAIVCCYFPALLVAGPLACGLYACGLATLRGRPIDSDTLWRGWPATWSSMGAWIVVTLLGMLPMVLLQIFMFVVMFGLGAVLDSGPPQAGHGAKSPDGSVIVFMLGTMGVMMLGMLLSMVWVFWINTRTMFILPLIADRNVDFGTAWRMSWEATRTGFWELLLLQFLAGLIGGLGIYVCYVGVIFTLPIYFTLIATAYEHRFAGEATTQ